MERSVLTIASSNDLILLNPYRRHSKEARRTRYSEIKLQLNGMTPAEIVAKEKSLNRLYFDCGCAEATALGLAALAGLGAWLFFRPGGIAEFSTFDAATLVVGFFTASGLGKWIGRLRARSALAREVNALRTHLTAGTTPDRAPHAKCGHS